MHSHSLTECNGAGSWRALGQRGRAPAVDRPGLRNRQRIAAELMRVRMALDERLEDDAEARIVMVRDPDDGPGADFFEEHHLIHDMVAVMSGNRFNPRRMLRRAFIDRELRDRNGPARFHDVIDISGTGGCRSTTPCSPPRCTGGRSARPGSSTRRSRHRSAVGRRGGCATRPTTGRGA